MRVTPFMILWETLTPVARWLLIMWLLEMISVPVITWLSSERARLQGIKLGVILQAGVVIAIAVQDWGAVQTLKIALVVAVLTWTIEFAGSRTGIPFGAYHYTDRLRPQLGGVPILIPLAWLMMLPPAWAVAETTLHLLPPLHDSRIAFVLVSALTFTVWDLFLDPQMVKWQLWVWDGPSSGGYFGIPWTNYAGWFLCAAALTAVLSPPSVSPAPMVAIYGLTWFLESVGQIAFWGLPGPGLVGAISMGAFFVSALISLST